MRPRGPAKVSSRPHTTTHPRNACPAAPQRTRLGGTPAQVVEGQAERRTSRGGQRGGQQQAEGRAEADTHKPHLTELRVVLKNDSKPVKTHNTYTQLIPPQKQQHSHASACCHSLLFLHSSVQMCDATHTHTNYTPARLQLTTQQPQNPAPHHHAMPSPPPGKNKPSLSLSPSLTLFHSLSAHSMATCPAHITQ